MLTPAFTLVQNDNFILLSIKALYVKANEVEIYIEGNEFKFYVKPYFLRLYFPCEVVEDGRETAQYDISTGMFDIQIPKKNDGEHFPNLDMLTTLLAPKKPSTKKPLIEVVGSNNVQNRTSKETNDGDLSDEDGDDDDDDDDEICWEIEQELYESKTEECLTGYKYGFANQSSGVLARLQDELYDVIDVYDPDNTSYQDRKENRIKAENEKFDKDHYLADYFDCDVIEGLISYKAPWDIEYERIMKDYKESSYPETSNIIKPKGTTHFFAGETNMTFTEEEKYKLLQLPKKNYLLSKEEEHSVFLGLVDVIFAFAYNHRTTEGENTPESAWTISKLSPTLSWLESFKSVHNLLTSSSRRCLCYPLYRNWRLVNAVLHDVQTLFLLGKRWLLRCLLETSSILQSDENRHILNDLYMIDYCVWIQEVKCSRILSLANKLRCSEIMKSNMGFELRQIEDEASSIIDSCNIDTDSGSESDSSESTCSDESSTDSDDVTESNIEVTKSTRGQVNIEVISSSENSSEQKNPSILKDELVNKIELTETEKEIEVIRTGLEELLTVEEYTRGSEDIE